MSLKLHLPLVAIAMALAVPVAAQDGAAQDGAAEPNGAEAEAQVDNTIVVKGLHLRDDEDLPVKGRPLDAFSQKSRLIASDSDRFTRCAGLPEGKLLRRIVDGKPMTGETQKALHRYIVKNSACSLAVPALLPQPSSPYYGVCNPQVVGWVVGNTCRVPYDRGAIYEETLREYAPDLRLTRSNTFARSTIEAFRTREEARNQSRQGPDARFFWIASCMTQIRPEYATAMLQSEQGSQEEARYMAMMLSDGRQCIGDQVEEITVVPGQFRAYVAEAVYSWAVATRRQDTLLPGSLGA